MIASLPMYARPELNSAHNRFWTDIRNHLRINGMDAPRKLGGDDNVMSIWTSPDLVLSQTCGMPYRLFLHGKVHLVGTPDYGLDGCPKGHYRSAIVARKDDGRRTLHEFADAVFAYNEEHSQSGLAAPLVHAATLGVVFRNRTQSHGHRYSARMVANGAADIASLDAVSWELMQRYDDFASKLKVIDWTAPPTPALPFITAITNDPEVVFRAIKAAIQDLNTQDKANLGLRGILKIPAEHYLAVPNPSP